MKATEKQLVRPQLIAYVKCLIIVGGYNHQFETCFIPESEWFSMTSEFVCHAILFRIIGNLCCMDQDVYLCSRFKQQPQGYFDAKRPAVADDNTDAAANLMYFYIQFRDFYSKMDILVYLFAYLLQMAAVRTEAEAVLDRDRVME